MTFQFILGKAKAGVPCLLSINLSQMRTLQIQNLQLAVTRPAQRVAMYNMYIKRVMWLNAWSYTCIQYILLDIGHSPFH